jgi:dTDP-4-dehydrorhamnose 3,5-epimerase
MRVESTAFKDVFILHNDVHGDQRGYFLESFNQRDFQEQTGLDTAFVQDNQSKSQYGVLRGLHWQAGEHAQAKLVRVLRGSVLDVIVDLRRDSATFGKHLSLLLTDENQQQLYVPRGFAHGFVVLSAEAEFFYKCDAFYHKEAEQGIIYNDPALAINWQIPDTDIILSPKDQQLPYLATIPDKYLF